jgi:hypothetical protein
LEVIFKSTLKFLKTIADALLADKNYSGPIVGKITPDGAMSKITQPCILEK